jgi:hypothetical protein
MSKKKAMDEELELPSVLDESTIAAMLGFLGLFPFPLNPEAPFNPPPIASSKMERADDRTVKLKGK